MLVVAGALEPLADVGPGAQPLPGREGGALPVALLMVEGGPL